MTFQQKPDHEPTYSGVHERLRRTRGKASSHPCVDCGEPASQWSCCPCVDDLRWVLRPCGWVSEPSGRRWVSYSVDLSDYDPRCSKCHRSLDVEFRPCRDEAGA